MKAIVTFSERSESDRDQSPAGTRTDAQPRPDLQLGVRLLAEGANDRLLLRMMEIQYPAMRRVNENGGRVIREDEPAAVDVPMPEDRGEDGAEEIRVSSIDRLCFNRAYVVSAKHSPRGAFIRHAELLVDDSHWRIIHCRVNGRARPVRDGVPSLGDIPPGALVEIEVERGGSEDRFSGGSGNEEIFRATIRGAQRELRVGDVVELIDDEDGKSSDTLADLWRGWMAERGQMAEYPRFVVVEVSDHASSSADARCTSVVLWWRDQDGAMHSEVCDARNVRRVAPGNS
jgi:hypothetical protein